MAPNTPDLWLYGNVAASRGRPSDVRKPALELVMNLDADTKFAGMPGAAAYMPVV